MLAEPVTMVGGELQLGCLAYFQQAVFIGIFLASSHYLEGGWRPLWAGGRHC